MEVSAWLMFNSPGYEGLDTGHNRTNLTTAAAESKAPTANTLQLISGNQFSVKQITVRILNTAGQTILTQQLPYADARIDVSKLSSGIYFIEIKNANGAETYLQKFVK